jgi:glycosyltransferase involved in cell wall biosynthesis
MKVLHLISSGGMYGAEAVILSLTRAMSEKGHSSELALFHSETQPNEELELAAERASLPCHRIATSGPLDRTIPAQLRALMKQTGADVLHTHGYKADVYAWTAFRSLPVAPLVSTCHNWIDTTRALRIYGRLDRRVLRGFGAVIAVSEDVASRLRASGIPGFRVHLVRNGIDIPSPAGPIEMPPAAEVRDPMRPLTVGLVARLSPEKGVDVFLRAAAQVKQQLPGIRFVVAGEGPDRPVLEQLIDTLGLQECVTLMGRVEDMPAFYASIDLLVCSSRTEGLPMALLEGMAVGLPVVATPVGEVPQLVLDGRSGCLVPVDDPAALAAAISSVLRDAGLRASMGLASRARVKESYSAQRMATAYVSVYQEVLTRVRRASASA